MSDLLKTILAIVFIVVGVAVILVASVGKAVWDFTMSTDRIDIIVCGIIMIAISIAVFIKENY